MSLSIKKSRTPLLTTTLSSSYRFHPKQINSTTAKWYNLRNRSSNLQKQPPKPNILKHSCWHPATPTNSSHLSPSRSFLPRNDWPHNVPMPTRTAHWQQHGPTTSRSRDPAVPLPWEIGSRCGFRTRNCPLLPGSIPIYLVYLTQSIAGIPVYPNLSSSLAHLPVWQPKKSHAIKSIELSNQKIKQTSWNVWLGSTGCVFETHLCGWENNLDWWIDFVLCWMGLWFRISSQPVCS